MKGILLLVLLALFACSDFHVGYSPGGNPLPAVVVKDTLRDTTVIPSDSIIVKTKQAKNDTLINKMYPIRAGNYAELRYTVQLVGSADSIHIYGASISNDSLTFGTNIGSASFNSLDGSANTFAGNLLHYPLSLACIPGQAYGLRWYNNGSTDAQVNSQLIVGYSSTDSTAHTTATSTLYEYRQVALRTKYSVQAYTSIWEKIPVMNDDSLLGAATWPQGMHAKLLSSAEMSNLFSTGTEGTGLWQSTQGHQQIRLRITQPDTLYYLIVNDGAASISISDTLMLSKIIL